MYHSNHAGSASCRKKKIDEGIICFSFPRRRACWRGKNRLENQSIIKRCMGGLPCTRLDTLKAYYMYIYTIGMVESPTHQMKIKRYRQARQWSSMLLTNGHIR